MFVSPTDDTRSWYTPRYKSHSMESVIMICMTILPMMIVMILTTVVTLITLLILAKWFLFPKTLYG